MRTLGKVAEPETVGQLMPRSILDGLKQRKLRLEDELNKVTEAVDAMEKNPAVAELLEKVTRAGI